MNAQCSMSPSRPAAELSSTPSSTQQRQPTSVRHCLETIARPGCPGRQPSNETQQDPYTTRTREAKYPLHPSRPGHSTALNRIESHEQLPRNSSLLFDLETDDDSENAISASDAELKRRQLAVEQLQSLAQLGSAEEFKLNSIVERARLEGESSGRPLTCDSLAELLQDLGYTVWVRKAIGGGPGLDCLQNLHHKFLLVQAPFGSDFSRPCILDIDFKAQFQVAHTTPLYHALLDSMANCFVGDESKLRGVLNFLCEEMASAFRELGIQLPPWRRARAMLSKWCPRRSEDSYPSDGNNVLVSKAGDHVARSSASADSAAMPRWTGFTPGAIQTPSNVGSHDTMRVSSIWSPGAGPAMDISLPWAAHANLRVARTS